MFRSARAFDPVRLWEFVTSRLDSGEFATVLRSKWFFSLSTRPGALGRWSQAGSVARFEPQGVADEPRQELVFLGVGLEHAALLDALATCLSDAVATDDPFPGWEPVHVH